MVTKLTSETFKEQIFDFSTHEEWNYKGSKPCLIDFYADWCGPCKALSPVLDELAKEYDGSIDIYKINTEEQQELASMFGIRSIPSLLFVPMDGKPQMATGALPKESFKKAFKEILNVER